MSAIHMKSVSRSMPLVVDIATDVGKSGPSFERNIRMSIFRKLHECWPTEYREKVHKGGLEDLDRLQEVLWNNQNLFPGFCNSLSLICSLRQAVSYKDSPLLIGSLISYARIQMRSMIPYLLERPLIPVLSHVYKLYRLHGRVEPME